MIVVGQFCDVTDVYDSYVMAETQSLKNLRNRNGDADIRREFQKVISTIRSE